MAENVLKFDLKFCTIFLFHLFVQLGDLSEHFIWVARLTWISFALFPLCSITALIPANPSTVANSPSMGARVVLLGVVDLIRDLIETLRVLSNKPKTAVDLNILKNIPIELDRRFLQLDGKDRSWAILKIVIVKAQIGHSVSSMV